MATNAIQARFMPSQRPHLPIDKELEVASSRVRISYPPPS